MNSFKVLCGVKDANLITILCSSQLLLVAKVTGLKVGRERGIPFGCKVGSNNGGFNDLEHWLVPLLPEMIRLIHFGITILSVFLEERKSCLPTSFFALFRSRYISVSYTHLTLPTKRIV